MRITLYQHAYNECPTAIHARADLVIVPPSTCPYTSTPILAPRGSYYELILGGRVYTHPCNTAIEQEGRRLLLLCTPPTLDERCTGIDAVVVALRYHARPGEALVEARRLSHRLMSLSWRCGAPVLYVNVWGYTGSLVYTGYTGVYDYSRGLPLHLGVEGDGRITAEV